MTDRISLVCKGCGRTLVVMPLKSDPTMHRYACPLFRYGDPDSGCDNNEFHGFTPKSKKRHYAKRESVSHQRKIDERKSTASVPPSESGVITQEEIDRAFAGGCQSLRLTGPLIDNVERPI